MLVIWAERLMARVAGMVGKGDIFKEEIIECQII